MNTEKAPEIEQHTPGDWLSVGATTYGDGVWQTAVVSDRMAEKGHNIIVWAMGATAEESLANARLMAAAPRLLAALKECECTLSRIACSEIAGMAAKNSAKSRLETIELALSKLTPS